MTHRQAEERVRAAFGSMSTRQRQIATLHFYGEFTSSEIAAALGISRQNVNTQITWIRSKLAREFGIETSPRVHMAKEEAA